MVETTTRNTAATPPWDEWIRAYLDGRLKLDFEREGLQSRRPSAADQSVSPPPLEGPAGPRPRRGDTLRPGGSTQAPLARDNLNRNSIVRTVAGDMAQKAGEAAGIVRGGVHAVWGLIDGAKFLSRLNNPYDTVLSPPGQSAVAQLADSVLRGAGYVRRGVADPSVVMRDLQNGARQMRANLDPTATPMAPTVSEEVRRRLNIGMNQGELAFDVGSFAIGGPLAKGVKGLAVVSKPSMAGKYLAQGFAPAQAAHLAEAYPASAMGHHFFPIRMKPPPAFAESVYNVLRPHGITRGDMYELHYRVDPYFYGTGFPARVGGGRWSGRALGLQDYGLPGRLWFGSPAPLKARVGGLSGSAGAVVYGLPGEEEFR